MAKRSDQQSARAAVPLLPNSIHFASIAARGVRILPARLLVTPPTTVRFLMTTYRSDVNRTTQVRGAL